jgi:hypothetical protein
VTKADLKSVLKTALLLSAAPRGHGLPLGYPEIAYIMALLGFGSGSSVLSQFFDGATEAPGLAVLRPFCKQTQSAVSAEWVFACRGISRQRLSPG